MWVAIFEHDRESIEQFVAEQIEAAGVDPALISPTATLDSLGLDSLDLVELSQGVKKVMGIPVSAKDFVHTENISDVIGVICRRAGIG
jgi:acyl carrier protein